jgi:hypothetical protein
MQNEVISNWIALMLFRAMARSIGECDDKPAKDSMNLPARITMIIRRDLEVS